MLRKQQGQSTIYALISLFLIVTLLITVYAVMPNTFPLLKKHAANAQMQFYAISAVERASSFELDAFYSTIEYSDLGVYVETEDMRLIESHDYVDYVENIYAVDVLVRSDAKPLLYRTLIVTQVVLKETAIDDIRI